jgi:hypothetical protein
MPHASFKPMALTCNTDGAFRPSTFWLGKVSVSCPLLTQLPRTPHHQDSVALPCFFPNPPLHLSNMHVFSFVSLLFATLAGVAATAPTGRGPLVAKSEVGHYPGSITVFSEPKFHGNQTSVYASEKCSENFAYGSIQSIYQTQGTVCHYFRDFNCEAANHSPSMRANSTAADWAWYDMQHWSGKVLSFRCDPWQQPRARSTNLSATDPLQHPTVSTLTNYSVTQLIFA